MHEKTQQRMKRDHIGEVHMEHDMRARAMRCDAMTSIHERMHERMRILEPHVHNITIDKQTYTYIMPHYMHPHLHIY